MAKEKVVLGEDGHYIVDGIRLHGKLLPKVGLSTVQCVGSDRYAAKITEVDPNYKWFKMSNQVAVLVTRKNSPRYGKYVKGEVNENGKVKPGPTPYHTCINFDTFHIVDYEAKTELDPSF